MLKKIGLLVAVFKNSSFATSNPKRKDNFTVETFIYRCASKKKHLKKQINPQGLRVLNWFNKVPGISIKEESL